ncbi:hypothetical protein DPMN_113010 [Dreissena polymorpha]|uniref:Uncharacterized protein n=1 Tax=Dreissena polymorpha TaxID=45954 RepID=A0A9D4QQJ6_DREPO|nr:hypothetical protein DPMN_113010 [Dreissena polymorpha]
MSSLIPLAFPINGYAGRQRSFEIRVFLFLDGLPTKDREPHLPEAKGARDPPATTILSVKNGLPGSEAKSHA